jgi:hypothetical protein
MGDADPPTPPPLPELTILSIRLLAESLVIRVQLVGEDACKKVIMDPAGKKSGIPLQPFSVKVPRIAIFDLH